MTAESFVTIAMGLLEGAATTVAVWGVTMAFSIPLALFVAVLRQYRLRPVNVVLGLYFSLVRGTPLLFQLMFVYFGFPLLLGVRLSPFASASIAFVNSWTVYLSEIFRGGIENVDGGQWEAGRVLGLSYPQIMGAVIIPQALAATLPSVTNQAIEAIWGTSLLSVIGMNDVLKSARVILMRDFTMQPLLATGILYLLFNAGVIAIFRRIEKRITIYRTAAKTKTYGND